MYQTLVVAVLDALPNDEQLAGLRQHMKTRFGDAVSVTLTNVHQIDVGTEASALEVLAFLRKELPLADCLLTHDRRNG